VGQSGRQRWGWKGGSAFKFLTPHPPTVATPPPYPLLPLRRGVAPLPQRKQAMPGGYGKSERFSRAQWVHGQVFSFLPESLNCIYHNCITCSCRAQASATRKALRIKMQCISFRRSKTTMYCFACKKIVDLRGVSWFHMLYRKILSNSRSQ
jgi:hypothetical protein